MLTNYLFYSSEYPVNWPAEPNELQDIDGFAIAESRSKDSLSRGVFSLSDNVITDTNSKSHKTFNRLAGQTLGELKIAPAGTVQMSTSLHNDKLRIKSPDVVSQVDSKCESNKMGEFRRRFGMDGVRPSGEVKQAKQFSASTNGFSEHAKKEERRRTACNRERLRMRAMNQARCQVNKSNSSVEN